MAHRSVPAPFLTKTYQLVEDSSTDDVISWNKTGTTFVVWKSAEFARDLLPNYFKHNNFSSFVRQLNTYGFRKIVPDRWEFSNDYFRRGDKELLCEIHRRKTVHASSSTAQVTATAGKSNGGSPSSQSNSGDDDLGSSSTSSPDTNKNQGSDETITTSTTQLSNLSDENEKLRKENQILSSELARTKSQCKDLTDLLSKYVKLQGGAAGGPSSDRFVEEICTVYDGDEKEKGEEEECLKLFGVWLKGKKRAGFDERGVEGPPMKEMKMIDYRASVNEDPFSSQARLAVAARSAIRGSV